MNEKYTNCGEKYYVVIMRNILWRELKIYFGENYKYTDRCESGEAVVKCIKELPLLIRGKNLQNHQS